LWPRPQVDWRLVAIEVRHRGQLAHKKMLQRTSYRRGRRSPNLRYRTPSLGQPDQAQRLARPQSPPPADTTLSMVARLRRWAPVTAAHQELVWFYKEKMESYGITAVEYPQGTLAGDEVREYLLAKWGWTCARCGATGAALNIDHIRPKVSGGSNRVSNLALACVVPSDQSRGKDELKAWGASAFGPGEAGVITKRVLAHAKAPLKDADGVNTTRWALYQALVDTGLPVTGGGGGRTKWNRSRFGAPKTHTLDALCIGNITGVLSYPTGVIVAKATGRGKYSRTTSDRFGFGRLRMPRNKFVDGFATGDLVRAVITKGKYTVVHVGRVAVRSKGMFRVTTGTGTNPDVHRRHCTIVQRADGWG